MAGKSSVVICSLAISIFVLGWSGVVFVSVVNCLSCACGVLSGAILAKAVVILGCGCTVQVLISICDV